MGASTAQEITLPSSQPGHGVGTLASGEVAGAAAAELAGSRSSWRQILSDVAIRTFDVIAAISLLVMLLPLIVAVAIAVRVESAGPVFFRCARVGYWGRPLQMLKFRKMRHDVGLAGCALTTDEDLRLTRVGRFLLKLKLDELPQLIHVIRGDMSLVGPRPEVPEFVSLNAREYAEILSVRPGITGLSQIAFFDESRILDKDDPVTHYVGRILPEKVALDRTYVSKRSLSLNLRILFWTVVTVFLRRQVAVGSDTGKIALRRR